MSTCYDCAYSKIEVIDGSRFLSCGIFQKYFCVPFSYPAPDICDKFQVKSGYLAWDVLEPEERMNIKRIKCILTGGCKFNPVTTLSECNDKEKTCTITEICCECGKKYTAVFTSNLGFRIKRS